MSTGCRTTIRLTSQLAPRVFRNEQTTCSASPASGRGQEDRQGGRGAAWGAVGVGLIGASIGLAVPLLAEEKKQKMIFGKTEADRVRQFATADNVFDHFANYQLVSESGKKTNLMSTLNFYNAMTPGSILGEDVKLGRSAYMQITQEELNSNKMRTVNMLPNKGGNLLNSINEHGLLTYTDYHFLLTLMSTPTRYLDIIFHGFDISADGLVEAKEFVHVMAQIADVKTDIDELMKVENTSGLVRYLFKDDLSGTLTRDDFVKLQFDLVTDVLEMEFIRYVKDINERISEVDFCRHLLYSSSLPLKKKEKMIKRVASEFKESKATGISFESFKTFYNVLFGGADLERAMFFQDCDNQGVTRDEFCKVANWVVGAEVDRHVIDVVYCLLDDNFDMKLCVKEFNPVLFSWRHSRGFQKGSLSVEIGNMKF